jgi:hypothetical protein
LSVDFYKELSKMRKPIIDNTCQGFKRCAGRDCKNLAKSDLKIAYINKVGTFCTSCRDKLVELGLASEQASNVKENGIVNE